MMPAQSRQKNGARNGFTDRIATRWPFISTPSPSGPWTRRLWSEDSDAEPAAPAPWLCNEPRRSSPMRAAKALSITVTLAPVS